MKSVLLVDDEYYIRIRVRKCVDWHALGFDTVIDCENGREALEEMGKRHFDLVVLDISMPVMDGLALCKEIRNRNYDAQIIILTGYDKFEYAKSAVGLGVIDYILKPIDGEEMERAVKKACRQIEKREFMAARLKEHDVLKSQSEQMKSDLFFSSILTDSFLSRPDMAEKLRGYGIEPEQKYRVVYFRSEPIPENILKDFQQRRMTVQGRCAQGRFLIFEDGSQQMLLSWLQGYTAQNLSEICFGVSSLRPGVPKELHKAYQEARFIVCQRLLEPETSFFCCDDYLGVRKILGVEQIKNYRDAYVRGLQEQNLQKICEAVKNAVDCLKTNRNSIFGLHLFLENILLDLQRITLHMNSEWIGDTMFKMQASELIYQSETLTKLKEQLIEMAKQCISQRNYFLSSTNSLLVKKVKQLVEEHYMDTDLGLSSIAQALALNASYLSDVFKRSHGQTLIQYITQVRMEKARDFLLAGDCGLAEVMERVGYTDPYYFSRRFKKFYGVSPSAFRRD